MDTKSPLISDNTYFLVGFPTMGTPLQRDEESLFLNHPRGRPKYRRYLFKIDPKEIKPVSASRKTM